MGESETRVQRSKSASEVDFSVVVPVSVTQFLLSVMQSLLSHQKTVLYFFLSSRNAIFTLCGCLVKEFVLLYL